MIRNLTKSLLILLTLASTNPVLGQSIHEAIMQDDINLLQNLVGSEEGLEVFYVDQDSSSMTPLMHAAKLGKPEFVQVLLDAGAKIDTTNFYGSTALRYGASSGDLSTVQVLVENGADIHKRNDSGVTAINYAYTSLEVVKYLNQKGLPLNERNIYGAGLMYYAAYSGTEDLVRFLLDKDISINDVIDGGWTPLKVAARYCHTNIFKMIYNHDEEQAEDVEPSWKPVHFASRYGCGEVVNFLLEQKVDPNAMSYDGYSPLILASIHGSDSIFDQLINYGADLNLRSERGLNVLHYSSSNGHHNLVEKLLKTGISISLVDNSRQTALHHASVNGHADIVRTLLENGAKIDDKDIKGWTALMLASRYGHDEVMRVLLEYSADVNTSNDFGYSALQLAVSSEKPLIISLLAKAGADLEYTSKNTGKALPESIKKGLTNMAIALVDAGANIELESYQGTALHQAIAHDQYELFEYLLEKGANVEAERTYYKNTPLFTAVASGNMAYVKTLVSHGANLYVKDRDDNTLLHRAARYGTPEIITYLLQHNLQVKVYNANEDTPLHLAVENGKYDIAKILIASGASLKALNLEWNSPLHLAFKNHHKRLIELLLDAGSPVTFKRSNMILEAALSGNYEYIERLKSLGAKYKYKDKNGNTLMHRAAMYGEERLLEMLLKEGLKVNETNKWGQSPLVLAITGDNEYYVEGIEDNRAYADVVELLLKNGADPDNKIGTAAPIIEAALIDDLNIIKLLLHYDANSAVEYDGYSVYDILKENDVVDFNRPIDNFQNTLLSEADSLSWAKFLIDGGADINARNKYGMTPIHKQRNPAIVELLIKQGAMIDQNVITRAARFGHTEKVKLLLDHGFKIDETDEEGKSLVSLAVLNQKWHTAFELLRLGANRRIAGDTLVWSLVGNAFNKSGSYLILEAVRYDQKDIVSMALEDRANLDVRDVHDRTCLSYAVQLNRDEMVPLLLGKAANPLIKDQYEKYPIDYAIEKGNLGSFSALLPHHDINGSHTRKGYSLLHEAIDYNETEIFELLIDKGINIT